MSLALDYAIERPEITITTRDFVSLAMMLERTDRAQSSAAQTLACELRRAQIVPGTDIDAETVTMRSLVRWLNEAGEVCRSLLVYPEETSDDGETVSVLSPLGTALLGLSEGESASYQKPDGKIGRATILKVFFQPEANRLDWA